MASGLTGIGVVIAVAAGVLLARRVVDGWLRKTARIRYSRLCTEAGLTLDDTAISYPHAHGQVEHAGMHVWVDELHTRGLTQPFLRIRTEISEPPALFIRRRQPELERSTWTEVLTGDPAFDGIVRVTAPDRMAARRWLTPQRRQTLLALGETVETWSVGDGVLGLSQRGVPDDAEWRRLLMTLAHTAQALGPS